MNEEYKEVKNNRIFVQIKIKIDSEPSAAVLIEFTKENK